MNEPVVRSQSGTARFWGCLLFSVFALALIAAGLYFGLPYVYRELVQPMRDNSTRLLVLESRLATDEAFLNERLAQEQSRRNALELTLSVESSQRSSIQIALTPISEIISYEATQVGQLILDRDAFAQQLRDQESLLANLERDLAEAQRPLAELRRDLSILQTMGLITRAQIYLSTNNFGLAEEQVLLAGRVLQAGEVQGMQPWLAYLDQAAAHLPDFPVLAASELELAWQMMTADGLPTQAFTVTPTIFDTPTPTPQFTPSPTLYATFTPTP